LELFNLANVAIKHGWMASKDDGETWNVLNETAKDYDTAVGKMVDGDVVASESTGGNDADKQQTIYQGELALHFSYVQLRQHTSLCQLLSSVDSSMLLLHS
jgi:hypothetical protein